MGDIVADGTTSNCPLCTGQPKITVLVSSAEGDSKKLANTGNFLFPPPPGAQCLLIPSAPAPCAPPSVSVIDPGQTPVDIDGKKALGAGCKLQCAKGGLLTVSNPAQTAAQHDNAEEGPSLGASAASLALDLTPGVGSGKSFVEAITGKDLVTGEETSRVLAVFGIIPYAKVFTKGGKVVKVANAAAKSGSKTKAVQAVLDQCRKKINNAKKHLKGGPNGELQAALKESKGEVVARKASGEPFDHVNEVRETQQKLKKTIEVLKKEFANPRATPAEIKEGQELLSEASRMLDHSEGYVPSIPFKNMKGK